MPAWAAQVVSGNLHFYNQTFLVNNYGAKANGVIKAIPKKERKK